MLNMYDSNATYKEPSIALMRNLLGSVSLEDVEQEEMTESERKDYCAAISAVFPRLEKDIKKFLHEQLLFIATNGVDMEQIQFARGTFNGLDMLLDHWRIVHLEYISKIPKEEFDKTSPINQI